MILEHSGIFKVNLENSGGFYNDFDLKGILEKFATFLGATATFTLI